jgi:hypothetical protein
VTGRSYEARQKLNTSSLKAKCAVR